jgi:hypothetical protein
MPIEALRTPEERFSILPSPSRAVISKMAWSVSSVLIAVPATIDRMYR